MPLVRLSRLRKNNAVRNWVSQTRLMPADFILPYFVVGGKGVERPIRSLPGISHLSIDRLIKDIDAARRNGVKAVLLFGIPETKDRTGSEAYRKSGVAQKAIRTIKKEFKDMVVITDVCLCGYTSHGHCGIIRGQRTEDRGQGYIIDNDKTLEILAKIALSHAEAGADLVAPSAMMDGQVKAIREALDRNGSNDVGILAYSAKYASNFYGPFREALDSAPQFGDRKSYQMDFRNSNEALREIGRDIDEGADIVMVKPALSYLDVIYRARQRFNIPIAAYNVSGEYAMVERYINSIAHSAERIELIRNIVFEILTSIKRAGADFIITYWAKEVCKWLKV